jgi:hypothetical protein
MARWEKSDSFPKQRVGDATKLAIDAHLTIEEDRVAGIFRWWRRKREQEAGGIRPHVHRARPHWIVVESVASPAMGSLYAQVLQQAGIPVQTKQWGAGAGAMGGALTGVRLLVPEDCLDAARDVLGVGRAGSEVEHE